MGKGARESWSRHWKIHRIKTARHERMEGEGGLVRRGTAWSINVDTEWKVMFENGVKERRQPLWEFLFTDTPTTTLESMWCDTQWDSWTLGKSVYLLLSPRINSITALGEKKILSSLKPHIPEDQQEKVSMNWGNVCITSYSKTYLKQNVTLLNTVFQMSYQSQFCISYSNKRKLCNLGSLGLSPEQFEKQRSWLDYCLGRINCFS